MELRNSGDAKSDNELYFKSTTFVKNIQQHMLLMNHQELYPINGPWKRALSIIFTNTSEQECTIIY